MHKISAIFRLRRVQQRRHIILRFTMVLFHYCINQKQIHNLPQILLSINHELIERRYFVKLAICWLSHLCLVYNMTNIFAVSLILLLFRLPKGSQNKSIKHEKLGKYWPFCIRSHAMTNA